MSFGFLRTKQARASRIDIKPPLAKNDRHGIAIVAILKNEANNLNDWLSFHTLAGVREFILYDNLSNDDTVRIANSFTGAKVTVIPWQLHVSAHKPILILPRQILAYCHAICTFGSAFRWMAFIDIDEYIVPKEQDTIAQALLPLEAFANISLPWVMFGHNGYQNAPTEPVPFAFTKRASSKHRAQLNFKCIVDPCAASQVSTHKFETTTMGNLSANTLGVPKPNSKRAQANFVSNSVLQLNHYYLKSVSELREKIGGGAVSGVSLERRAAVIEKKRRLIEMATEDDICATEFLSRHSVYSGDDLRAKIFLNQNKDSDFGK